MNSDTLLLLYICGISYFISKSVPGFQLLYRTRILLSLTCRRCARGISTPIEQFRAHKYIQYNPDLSLVYGCVCYRNTILLLSCIYSGKNVRFRAISGYLILFLWAVKLTIFKTYSENETMLVTFIHFFD